jgi:ankyrin repeat protein
MDVLPLPPRPDLNQYRKRAKELVAASSAPDAGAIAMWAKHWLEALTRLHGPQSTFVQSSFDRAVEAIEKGVLEALQQPDGRLKLSHAQFLLARAHGFASWPAFVRHLERLAASTGHPFEAAADAVVNGGLGSLKALLAQHRGLVTSRSSRTHRATLLHYVAANGVEDFRQRTPVNAVEIAKWLLTQGAAVDALAETYGGGQAQTTLNLLVSSEHPAAAGVQPALVETLLDFGAAINGLEDDGSPLMTALAFGYLDTAETLARRGARVDNIIAAASLGRVDIVRQLIDTKTITPSLVKLYWLGLQAEPKSHVERAFVFACAYGRQEVVELLLARGIDPAVRDNQGNTGLHWAAANGYAAIVKQLIDSGAPLEARNALGKRVLEWAVAHALHYPNDWPHYERVIETLLVAGAEVSAVTYPTGHPGLDELLRSISPRTS